MTVRDFMVQRVNGRKWVIARQSARLVAKGYEVFLSQAAYRAICREGAAAGATDSFYA